MRSMFRPLFALIALLALGAAGAPLTPAFAHEGGDGSAVKAEMTQWIEDAEKKLLELAEATPEAKYRWAPAKGVRSTAEVFLHVAAANFGIPTFWGVAPPEGFKFDGYEQSLTKKSDIQKALAASFTHMKQALAAADDETMNKGIELFGMKTTVRGAYMLMLAHAHEHLGQSIAYARSNKITPPWTARQEAAAKSGKK